MIATLLAILGIVAVGGRATGRLRTAQIESIIARLPAPEARAYYGKLVGRQRRLMIMRLVSLAALLGLFFAYRRHLVEPHPLPQLNRVIRLRASVSD